MVVFNTFLIHICQIMFKSYETSPYYTGSTSNAARPDWTVSGPFLSTSVILSRLTVLAGWQQQGRHTNCKGCMDICRVYVVFVFVSMLPVISCDAVWIEHYQYLLYLMLGVSLWKFVQDFKRVWKVAIQAGLWLDLCISLHFASERFARCRCWHTAKICKTKKK